MSPITYSSLNAVHSRSSVVWYFVFFSFCANYALSLRKYPLQLYRALQLVTRARCMFRDVRLGKGDFCIECNTSVVPLFDFVKKINNVTPKRSGYKSVRFSIHIYNLQSTIAH